MFPLRSCSWKGSPLVPVRVKLPLGLKSCAGSGSVFFGGSVKKDPTITSKQMPIPANVSFINRFLFTQSSPVRHAESVVGHGWHRSPFFNDGIDHYRCPVGKVQRERDRISLINRSDKADQHDVITFRSENRLPVGRDTEFAHLLHFHDFADLFHGVDLDGLCDVTAR